MNIHDIELVLKRNGIFNGLVVGSRALYEEHIVEGADLDVVVMPKDISHLHADRLKKDGIISMTDKTSGLRIEILVAYNNTLAELYNARYRPNGISVADINMLCIMKLGHIHRNMVKWEKHMADIVYIKKQLAYNENNRYYDSPYTCKELVCMYRKDTDERLGKQVLPNLNVTKEQFFDDGVTKYVDHDFLHEVLAHYDVPMYTKMQRNGEVYCHKDLWNSFSNMDKIYTVLEECYVIACERFIIPEYVKGSKEYYSRTAFMWALKRVCTDLTSGFFRDFAIYNYSAIVGFYKPNYYKPVIALDILNKD